MIQEHLIEQINDLLVQIHEPMNELHDWLKDSRKKQIVVDAAELITNQQHRIRWLESELAKAQQTVTELRESEPREDVFRSANQPWNMGKSRLY